MEETKPQNFEYEKLGPMLKRYLEAELARAYAYAAKNARLAVLGAFGFFVFAASVFLGLCLLVFGWMFAAGSSLSTVGTVAAIIGACVCVGALGFAALTASQNFWARLFRIEDVVNRLSNEHPGLNFREVQASGPI